jgi:hypothetical protein
VGNSTAMVTRRDRSAQKPPPANVLASPTLAELYRRQGHHRMAERLLAGLDPTQSEVTAESVTDSIHARRVRTLRTLLGRIRTRRRPTEEYDR